MSSIRKTKKAMKKSNGFFTAVMNNSICFCASEWDTIKYHKHGISVNDSAYVPYKRIKRIDIQRFQIILNSKIN